MPENKEIPNQNTLFSSNSQSHSPPKPAEQTKAPDAKAAPAADGKKPTEPAKTPDAKAAPAADGKKTAEPTKAPDAKAAPATDAKNPTELPTAPDTKATPLAATLPKTTEAAKDPVKGVKITQIFADRLDKPDDRAL